jgi:hypothetical protein
LSPPPGFTPSGEERVYFEEIEKLPAKQVPAVKLGFVWHPMEDAVAEHIYGSPCQ